MLRTNRATATIASTLGILLGIGGLDHGILEAVQGNAATRGQMINALAAGTSWSLLKQGGEGAFTIIPSFLLTGILSTATALAIIIWSAWFIHRRFGSLVLLLLCVLLFLVGGGIAQVLFVAITFAVTTRIHAPLRWWRKALPVGFRRAAAGAWCWTLAAATLLFLAALEMAVVGFVPGVNDQRVVLTITWSTLGGVIVLVLFSIVAGFACDISENPNRQFRKN